MTHTPLLAKQLLFARDENDTTRHVLENCDPLNHINNRVISKHQGLSNEVVPFSPSHTKCSLNVSLFLLRDEKFSCLPQLIDLLQIQERRKWILFCL